MPGTLAQGVLGLEGIHNITSRFDMNVLGSLPRARLDRINGLHSMADLDDNKETNYGRSGETFYVSETRGRTIVYEGRLQAASLPSLRQLETDMREACSFARRTVGVFTIRHFDGGGVQHRFYGRVLTLEIDDEQTRGAGALPTKWQRQFTLTVRADDPRYEVVGADVSVSGVTEQWRTITNPGNAPGEPKFFVSGPILGGLIFERSGNFIPRNLSYYIPSLIPSGDGLVLDFATRTLSLQSDGSDMDHLRDFSQSNWWDAGAAALNVGATDIRVQGASWSCLLVPRNW